MGTANETVGQEKRPAKRGKREARNPDAEESSVSSLRPTIPAALRGGAGADAENVRRGGALLGRRMASASASSPPRSLRAWRGVRSAALRFHWGRGLMAGPLLDC